MGRLNAVQLGGSTNVKKQFEVRDGMTAKSEGKGVRGEGHAQPHVPGWSGVENGGGTWNLHNEDRAGDGC